MIATQLEAYDKYNLESVQVSHTSSDLEFQLQMHVHVSGHGNSLLHEY